MLGALAAAATAITAITHVTVIDATGRPPVTDATIVLRGDRIAAVGGAAKVVVPRGAVIVDGRGRWAIPGLCDAHVHLTLQPGVSAERVLLPLLIAHGVVGVRDMGGDWETLQELRRAVEAGRVAGPRLVAAGPFVDGPPVGEGPFVPAGDAAQGREAVRRLQEKGVDFIKVQAALAPDAWRAIVEEGRRRRIVVAGHVPEAVDAGEASDAGQRSLEHASPALPGDAGILLACSSEEPALRAELLALRALGEDKRQEKATRDRALRARLVDTYDGARCAALARRLARNGTFVVPTLVWSDALRPLSKDDRRDLEGLRFLPATVGDKWRKRRAAQIEGSSEELLALNRRVAEGARRLVADLHRAGVPLAAGTDSFDGAVLPGDALHEELEKLVAAGLTPLEALQAATRNVARLLDREKSEGTLTVGRRADVVLLDADPLADIRHTRRIHAVVAGGRLWTRADLDRLLTVIKRHRAAIATATPRSSSRRPANRRARPA